MSQEKEEDLVLLWDKEQIIPHFTSLKLAPGSAEHAQYINVPTTSSYSEDYNPSGIPLYQPSYPSSQKTLRCSVCNTTFENREEQVEHYKTDLHRFNLKRSLEGIRSLSIETDDENTDDDDEEENDFSEEESTFIKRKPRVFFINADDEVISIFRTVLQHKNADATSEIDFIHRANAAPRKLYWVIILVAGGHFSGAVYKGPEVIVHKTFHSYTGRSKQGGTQSSRDNKSATSHPRSAGANLRRYNEQSFNQHVQELMEEWRHHIANCDLIFSRCPKRNCQLLYGGPNPLLSRQDQRIRTIPFVTKKPTFHENKKVHNNLAEIIIHGKIKNISEMEKEKEGNKKTLYKTGGDKEEEKTTFKKLTKGDIADIDTRLSSPDFSNDEDGDVIELTTSVEKLSSRGLNSFGNLMEKQIKIRKEKRKKKKKKEIDDNSSPSEKTEDKDVEENLIFPNKKMRSLENFLYSSCRTGNVSNLKEFVNFNESKDYTDVPDAIPRDAIDAILETKENWDWKSMKFGMNEKTLLHIASENGHKELIWWLLEMGCDPGLKNKRNETPFMATKVKEAKNHFRRFMASYPDKFDYKKANVPSPLTKEQELEQKAKQVAKKKQQKKTKEEKEKEVKIEREKLRKEEEERKNFLQLSDRDKRAMAAERRILAAKQQNSSVSRCFQCAEDLSSIMPFEYSDFKFCSTKCVKEHRLKNKA